MLKIPLKVKILFASILLFILSLTAAPKIEVDNAHFDFGTFREGEKKSIKHTFVIKNTGKDTLIIEKVKPGWGCTAVGHDSIILPGQEGTVTQEIKISKTHSGKLRKYVTVISNAKNSPRLKLSLKCVIRSELGFEPKYLSLKPNKKSNIKKALTVTTRKKDLVINDIIFKEHKKPGDKGSSWQEALPMHIPFELTKTDKVSDDGYLEYKLELSLTITDNVTTYGDFTITSNHPKKKSVTLKGVILKNNK